MTSEPMPRLLLKPAEAAEKMGICRANIYAMVKSGEIPHVTIGSRVFIPVRQLEEWIEAHTERTL